MAAYEQKQPPQYNYNGKGSNDMICFICNKQFEDSKKPTWERWRKLDDNRKAHPLCFKCNICKNPITGKYRETNNGSFLCLDNGCVKKQKGDNIKQNTNNNNKQQIIQRYCFICQQQIIGSYTA
eukprot:792994_1